MKALTFVNHQPCQRAKIFVKKGLAESKLLLYSHLVCRAHGIAWIAYWLVKISGYQKAPQNSGPEAGFAARGACEVQDEALDGEKIWSALPNHTVIARRKPNTTLN